MTDNSFVVEEIMKREHRITELLQRVYHAEAELKSESHMKDYFEKKYDEYFKRCFELEDQIRDLGGEPK